MSIVGATADECRDCPPPLPEGLLCPDCAYDLRALTSDRCPECGFDLAPIRRRESALPWRRRRQIGWLRAFWGTVWLVTFDPRRLRIEAAISQPLRDARLFWAVTYLHFTAGAAAALLAGGCYASLKIAADWPPELWWLAAGVAATVLVWIWFLPGLATYFFQTRRFPEAHADRVRAVSHYVWGVAAWWILPAILLSLGILAVVLRRAPWDSTAVQILYVIGIINLPRGEPLILTAYVLAFPLPIVQFLRFQLVSRRLLHRSRWASDGTTLLVLLASIVLLVLFLLVPAGLVYFAIIYTSLQQ